MCVNLPLWTLKLHPGEDIYTDMQRQRQELSRLFCTNDPRGPILGLYDGANVDKEGWHAREALEYYPETPGWFLGKILIRLTGVFLEIIPG